MVGRTFSLVALVLVIGMQAFIVLATGNAKILTLFGSRIGLIAVSDLYACLVFSIVSFLLCVAMFVAVVKSGNRNQATGK